MDTAALDTWIKVLQRRFKEDTGNVVKAMTSEGFIIEDVLHDIIGPREYAQNIFRYARLVDMGNI